MEVKRFFSPTMQEALKAVREEFGPDAVILSNNKVDDGVEIVAALDYEEDMAPDAIDDQLASQGKPSPSQLARMHADNHLKLRRELDTAKRKIETLRSKRFDTLDERAQPSSEVHRAKQAASQPKHGASSVVHDAGQVKSAYDNDAAAQISAMHTQLAELKELIRESSGRQVESSDSESVQRERFTVAAPAKSSVRTQIEKKLEALSLSSHAMNSLLSMVDDSSDYPTAWRRIVQRMNYLVNAEEDEIIDRGGRVALVGPTGSGKTMTIGKLAARYVMKYGADSLALVTTDRYRIAAHEQLKVFGRILNVPVHVVDEHNSLDNILGRLTHKKLVLIDTAGLTHVDSSWSEQLQEIKLSHHEVQCYLTVSSVGQYQVMCANYQHYKMVGLAGAVITKVDEAVSLGEVISFLMDTRLTAAYMTDGQRVPEDIHQFKPLDMIEKAQNLLNSSERWVSVSAEDQSESDKFLFSHSA